MRFSAVIILAFLTFVSGMAAQTSAGMTAYQEGNFNAAIRLLPNEMSLLNNVSAKEYLELAAAYIESLLRSTRTADARTEITKIKPHILPEMKNRFDLIEAQLLFIENDLKNSEKILKSILQSKPADSNIYCNAVSLLADIYLKTDHAADAANLIADTLKKQKISQNIELQLKLQELRALATCGKLNSIPAKLNELKTKFPSQQGRFQHFELLLHAINQNLPEYNKLFKKLFPNELPLRAFIGDPVLYQGSLLAEQQAQKEKKIAEIAFHLKNQTFFAPNDEFRADSCKNLIRLHLTSGNKKEALQEVKSMLNAIPDIPDRMQWEMVMADLMRELTSGDHGLQIFLKIRNNKKAPPDLRAKAATGAAEIYRKQNKKSEMLKQYAFLADFPNSPAINNMGILLTGKYYFENKEYRMGESILSRITPDSANYPEAMLYLIQCKIYNGELDAALQDINKLSALKDINDDSIPELTLAAAYFHAVISELRNKTDEAAAMFEKIARAGSKRSGGTPLIISSWQKAAELQFKRQSYSNAGLLFLTFAEQYPTHPSSVTAFYKSVYSYFIAGRFDEMAYSIGKLNKNFPDHPLTVNALFHQMDHLRESDRMQEALILLNDIEKINIKLKNQSTTAQICYDRAVIFYHLQQFDNALKNLDELQKYPEQAITSEGMFLAGTIAAEQGDLQKSAEYYLKAASMPHEEKLFSSVCYGRAADNFFIAGSKNKDEKTLRKAAEIYNSLVKKADLTADFKLQCFYKLGRTLENINNFQEALDAYTEALYLPEISGNKNPLIRIWLNKSALNAINIHLRLGGNDALTDAIYIIRRLRKLNSMTKQELDNLEYNVRERYIQND